MMMIEFVTKDGNKTRDMVGWRIEGVARIAGGKG